MSIFKLTMADNVHNIKKWHDKKHTGPWHECHWEPYSETEEEWRRCWGTK